MRKLLQQALDALKTCDWDYDYDENPIQTYDEKAVVDAIEELEHELNKPEFLTAWREHSSPYEQGFIDGMAKMALNDHRIAFLEQQLGVIHEKEIEFKFRPLFGEDYLKQQQKLNEAIRKMVDEKIKGEK